MSMLGEEEPKEPPIQVNGGATIEHEALGGRGHLPLHRHLAGGQRAAEPTLDPAVHPARAGAGGGGRPLHHRRHVGTGSRGRRLGQRGRLQLRRRLGDLLARLRWTEHRERAEQGDEHGPSP